MHGAGSLWQKRTTMMDIVKSDYDLRCVRTEDEPVALEIIRSVVTMEEQMPKLDFQAAYNAPLYSFIFRGFNEYIDLAAFYDCFVGPDRDMKLDGIVSAHVNPHTGALIIRWQSMALGSGGGARADADESDDGGSSRRRRRRHKKRRRR